MTSFLNLVEVHPFDFSGGIAASAHQPKVQDCLSTDLCAQSTLRRIWQEQQWPSLCHLENLTEKRSTELIKGHGCQDCYVGMGIDLYVNICMQEYNIHIYITIYIYSIIIYIYICNYTYIYSYTYIYIYLFSYLFVYNYIHTYIYNYIHILYSYLHIYITIYILYNYLHI